MIDKVNQIVSEDEECSVNDDSMEEDLYPCDTSQSSAVKRSINSVVTDDENNSDSKAKLARKKRKLRKINDLKKLEKPATVEELNRLRETENLFHSNLFRRQIEEMLAELEMKNKLKVRINCWFDKFKSWVEKMEKGDSQKLVSLKWKNELQKIKFPLEFGRNHDKGQYRFAPVSDIKIIGSYPMKTYITGDVVDINVKIPSSFFAKDDHLNGRYFIKRAMYLCDLANHLTLKGDLIEDVKFSIWNDDNLRPMIELTPAGKLSGKILFLIHLVTEQSSFKLTRFIPTKNNVKSKWFFGDDLEINDNNGATAGYNTGILRDLLSDANDCYLSEIIGRSDQLRNALVLLKVWAKQRELLTESYSDNLLTFVVAYLLLVRKIHVTMSSYQIIRAVWNYLGTANWNEYGITMCQSSSEQQPPLTDFHKEHPLVFIDPSGFLNLCGGMCPSMFQRWKDEAVYAVKNLDTPDINCFHILFMVPVPFSRLCDQFIIFDNWSALEKMVQKHTSRDSKLQYCHAKHLQARDILTPILKKALGNRVSRLFVRPNPRQSWAVNKRPKLVSNLTLGIILDPVHCFNLLDKGPEADGSAAEDFRLFWKERSELRRFKDGSITESVVWSGKTWSEKRMICKQVAEFILDAHLDLSPAEYSYLGNELETVLPTERESQSSSVITGYDKLAKDLRELSGLPLDVTSTQGASAVFRWSESFPPVLPVYRKNKKLEKVGNCMLVPTDGYTVPPWCASALVILQLGSSNKWPSDVDAVRRLRAAFNLKIAELLRHAGYVTHAYIDWVDVLTDACVFRLQIVYPGEIGLMKKTLSPDGTIMYRDTKESLQLERIAVHLPNLTSSLNGLQSQHNSYGTACCLAKQWVRSHMFHHHHISDEAIDLLVAVAYVNPEPWLPPNQPQLAFHRFIALLALTDWNVQCFILNFNQVLSEDEKRQIEMNFHKNRESLPSLFIATPDEKEKSVWTRDGPSAVVLHRIAALANRTLSILTAHVDAPQNACSLLSIMQPSTSVFDALIHLNAKYIVRKHESLNNQKEIRLEAPGSAKYTDAIPVTDYDPPQCYINDLQESFGEWALFFYNPCGGCTIGVLWKPGSRQPRPFKVSHLAGRTWDRQTNMLHLNVDSILQSFYILGTGLVKTVQVKKDNEFVDVRL